MSESDSVVIKHEFPPNIELIRKRFPLSGNEIFAYDNVIYHPGSGHLTAPLIAHEKVHFRQQGDDPDAWWQRYIMDGSFRYEQELEAHREELRVFCLLTKDRNKRWRYAGTLARRLGSPMYELKGFRNVWQIQGELVRGIMR